MKITNENFAELLRNVRKKKHWSQEGLGRRFGVGGKAISAWEIGRSMPRSKILLGVANFIEVNI